MVPGKPFHQGSHEIRLPAEEDSLPGNKDVVEDGQDLMTPELMVAHIEGGPLQLPRVAGLASVDEEEPFRVGGYGKGDGVVLLVLPEGHGGHDDNFLGIGHPGLMGFGPPHDHPVLPALHQSEEHIGRPAGWAQARPSSVMAQPVLFWTRCETLESFVVEVRIFVRFEGGAVEAFLASMPTQRWKQEAVFCPRRRCILTLFTRSWLLWWMAVKRLMVLPLRWERLVIRPWCSFSWASRKVMVTE
jgi:hypothetical protein